MTFAARNALVLGLLLLASACGEDPARPAPAAVAAPAAPEASSTLTAHATPSGAVDLAAMPLGATISDKWYEIRTDHGKSGWYHMVWTRAELDGRPTIHDHTESASAETRLMGGMEDVFESFSVSDLDRDEDGMLLRLRTVVTRSGRDEVAETRREGGTYVWTQEVAGREERRTLTTPGLVPVDTEAFLAPKIRRGEIVEGQELTFESLNFLGERVDTVRLRVEARETIGTRAGSAECWRVVQTVDGMPGKSTWWIDTEGVLARLREGTLLVDRTTEDDAKELDASAAAYEITLRAEPDLPRATSLDRCVVDVAMKRVEGLDLPDFPATPFSREVSRDGDTIRVEMTAHDDAAATVALPVTDRALAKYLEATNLYAPDHPSVRRAVRAALSTLPAEQRSDGRAVAKAFARFVFRSLQKGSGPIPNPTAPEILADGGGDCSEHAVLFVALCRSAGLPARRLSGYAQVGDLWGSHSFCEIWLGKWVGADPTTNEIGTRARYLCFGWDEDPDSFPGLVSSRCLGRMRIRTVEFTDGGTTMSIEDATARKALRDDLSGLVLAAPPDGWTANVRRGNAVASGPEGDVQVHVSAGVGDLDVADLQATQFRNGKPAVFCKRPALRVPGGFFGRGSVMFAVPWRRRTVTVVLKVPRGGDEAAAVAVAEKLLQPTFSE